MAFDFKKEYKEFYMPKNKPAIVSVPKMNYIAVRGSGDPNEEDGGYKKAIGLLYAVAFTIKMSKMGDHKIEGYFDYVVPPLEGFWWQDGVKGVDYSRKSDFHWISVIRLPDFVTEDDFRWAVKEATEKKKQDFSAVEFLTIEEGLCVQCMHIGPYDDEPATVELMHAFMEQEGYELDISDKRLHHEIYLSDARKAAPEKLKTVIRHPVKAKNKIAIREERISAEEYIEFLKRTDLGSQYPKERFAERIAKLVKNVSVSLAARNEEGLLVGVLFGLTDFCYWLYVTDLGVDRDYERQGIATRLMKEAHELAGGEKDIAVYLIANENAVPFYEKLGMKFADDVMQYNHIDWTEWTVE